MVLQKIDQSQLNRIKPIFRDTFMGEPWNDDWSDDGQLTAYLEDLMGNRNSLSLGLYDGEELIGLCLGSIMHWCLGNEYYIYEFFLLRERQGAGLGADFLQQVEEYVKPLGVNHLYLQTDRSMPAYRFYQKNGFTDLGEHASLFKML